MAKSIRDIEKIWSNVEGVKKLSDRAVGVGPFGVGMDGLLTWIPVVGDAYTVGAGGCGQLIERRTSLPDVWAGGDCASGGEDLTVVAVQDGKLAAESIHWALMGV